MARRTRRRVRAAAGPPAVTTSRDPRFEALSIVVATAPRTPVATTVTRVLARARLRGWTAEPVARRPGEFELLPPRRRPVVTPGAAWDIAHRLRDQPEVVSAEPLFAYRVTDQHVRPTRRASGRGDGHHPGTETDHEWSLKTANVIRAWGLFGTRVPGAGATVGHPDTGHTAHPELADPSRVLVGQGFDFEDDDPDPLDDLDDAPLDNPGHGTGTGSVIASNRGAATGNNGPAFV
jgi:hypothetical protein